MASRMGVEKECWCLGRGGMETLEVVEEAVEEADDGGKAPEEDVDRERCFPAPFSCGAIERWRVELGEAVEDGMEMDGVRPGLHMSHSEGGAPSSWSESGT